MTPREAAGRFLTREAKLDAAMARGEIGLFTHGSAMDDALTDLMLALESAAGAS